MAQNITWLGNSYTDVPALTLPKTGGGTARFTDATPTTAVEADVASGKIFVKADGSLGTGTNPGGGTAAISVVDTLDTHGGTIREITALDISDTTAIASDVASGKYFYTAQGVKTQGTASGGGGGAAQHTIHLEFTDSTDTDIEVDYDDPFIATIITAYTPETYGQKTVDSASLDGVVWYTRPTETWETVYEVNGKAPNQDTPYNYFWLNEQDIGNVYPTANSVWRITIDNAEYRCTATYIGSLNQIYVGNPKYAGGSDDGSDAPFDFYNAGWGAWVGDTELPTVGHHIKIEHLVGS